MAKVTDGIQRDIAEIKLENERVYPITHAEAVVVKEGPDTGANKGVFLDEVLETIDSTLDTITDPNTGYGKRVSDIEGKIPSQATSSNQLADKAFVNSSISTATATFRDSYNLITDLNLPLDATPEQKEDAIRRTVAIADNNDYAFILIPTSTQTPNQIRTVERYKYSTDNKWHFEYELNSSGFTAEQWAAINSGITATDVTNYDNGLRELENKAIKSEMNVSVNGDQTTITLKTGTSATVINQHQNISGKADKASTVSNVSYSSKKLTKTINGAISDVVSASTIFNDGAVDASSSQKGLMSSAHYSKLEALPTSAALNTELAKKATVVDLWDSSISSIRTSIDDIQDKVFTWNKKPIKPYYYTEGEGDTAYVAFILSHGDGYDDTFGLPTDVILYQYDSGDLAGGVRYTNNAISENLLTALGYGLATSNKRGMMSNVFFNRFNPLSITVADSKYDPDYQVSGDPQVDFNN